jgi:Concanavalin A-like lectin/glucanases superfamily
MRRGWMWCGLLGVLGLMHVAWGQDFTTGLAAYWPADAGSGTTLADSTGNGHTATFGASTAAPTWMTGASCKIGAACVRFDGVNDIATFTGISLGTTYTLAMWVFPETGTAPDYGQLLGDLYLMHNTLQLNFWYTVDHFSTTSLTTTVWNHVAMVSSAGTITYYINGTTAGGPTGAPPMTAIDMGNNGSAEAFLGRLDDMRIYTRALTQADITALVAFTGAAASSRKRISAY